VTKFNKDPIKKEYSYSLSSKEKYSEIYLKNKVRQRIPLMPTFCWVEQDAKVNIFPFLDILNLAYACALQEQMTMGLQVQMLTFSQKTVGSLL
jgi:hypothetical protein